METHHLTQLAKLFAAHAGRSEMTIARWCGVHTRLFKRLSEGHGCRVDTYNEALRAFSARWPEDLAWPQDIPRPEVAAKSKTARRVA